MGAPEPAAPLSQPAAAFSYEHEGDRQFATTLARGLEVLRCFTPLEPLLGNKEISVRTGLPKPTVSRLTYTLTKLGYLRHNIRLGKYQLGSAVLSIGYPLLASIQAICARIGATTGKGIAQNLRQHYSPWLLRAVVLLLLVANVINLGADLGAMGAVLALVIGLVVTRSGSPAPVRITQRTSRSASSSDATADNASSISMVSALSLSGRLRVMVAMP